jgi:hypothetical protein
MAQQLMGAEACGVMDGVSIPIARGARSFHPGWLADVARYDRSQAQELAEIMDHVVEDAGRESASTLPIHRLSGRHIMRQQPPRHPGADDPPQAVQHLAHAMIAMRGLFGHEDDIGTADHDSLAKKFKGCNITVLSIFPFVSRF